MLVALFSVQWSNVDTRSTWWSCLHLICSNTLALRHLFHLIALFSLLFPAFFSFNANLFFHSYYFMYCILSVRAFNYMFCVKRIKLLVLYVVRYTNKVQLNCIVYIYPRSVTTAADRAAVRRQLLRRVVVRVPLRPRGVARGPLSSSPLIARFCGSASPRPVLSGGRFVWVRFSSDDELEGTGFQVRYHFTPTRILLPTAAQGLAAHTRRTLSLSASARLKCDLCLEVFCTPCWTLVLFITCLLCSVSIRTCHGLSPSWCIPRVFDLYSFSSCFSWSVYCFGL